MVICRILKNPPEKITDALVIGLVALTEILVANRFFPHCAIYGLIGNKFGGILIKLKAS